MFSLRFDMRAPSFGASTTDLYRAAIDMCVWSEDRGAAAVALSEHHGTEDGHLPSPMLLGSAIAARTATLQILLAAIVLPFSDPVRLAEEISVLDIISEGRVSFVLGIGHRPEEYEHFGIEKRRRGQIADEKLMLLLRLLREGTVDYDGRRIAVTPRAMTRGGPPILIGGGSIAAAERAGRAGLGLMAQANPQGMQEAYDAASRAAGYEPGFTLLPDPQAATTVFVTDDVDRAWGEVGPHLLHDALMAASYRHGPGPVASISRAATVEELRATRGAYRILTVSEAADVVRQGGLLPLLPLCGGLAPKVAWPYLEHAADAVARARNSSD